MAELSSSQEDFLLGVSTETQAMQTDGLSQEEIIEKHISYNQQMAAFCERLLEEGKKSGRYKVDVILRGKKPRKPVTSLISLVES